MDLDIIRRIAERGLTRAQEKEDSEFIDVCQHILDEVHYLEQHERMSWIDETEEKKALYD